MLFGSVLDSSEYGTGLGVKVRGLFEKKAICAAKKNLLLKA
jgi:hypothetical protein